MRGGPQIKNLSLIQGTLVLLLSFRHSVMSDSLQPQGL